MKLTLEHAPNPDISGGGYWQPCSAPLRKIVDVSDLHVAVMMFKAWRDLNGLGGGNMTRDCGTVKDNGKPIARISYNGRVWTPFPYGHAHHEEIVLN